MVTTYEQYLQQKKALPVEKMEDLHRQILDEVGQDEEALKCYEDVVKIAAKYIGIRANWFIWNKPQRKEQNPLRTQCHNQVISCMDCLAECLRKQGKAAQWREVLGYEEEDKYNRKTIGDFACYIAWINGLNAR